MTNPVTPAQEVSVVTIRVSNFSKRFPVRNNCGWQSKERPQNERQNYSLLTTDQDHSDIAIRVQNLSKCY